MFDEGTLILQYDKYSRIYMSFDGSWSVSSSIQANKPSQQSSNKSSSSQAEGRPKPPSALR
ncbi:hypothetical protein DPMN_134544 [Dreissena polymorpha]|uniref:Uncharacterized protein n=1 Tax=Dreissena polymorpha TaxID=45954 RepID=A0A9D4JBZ9_DREPO|nr:hypothetical protein DPMN_134544 [Dreissena polymorpha]